MVSYIVLATALCQLVILSCTQIKLVSSNGSVISGALRHIPRHEVTFNESDLVNFTFTWSNDTSEPHEGTRGSVQVDCFGLGKTVARTLEWFFASKPNGTNALDVQFLLSSRKQPQRVHVFIGQQFGLEWTDFKVERRTVIIVHGFLSHGGEPWIADMEKAFLRWGDVNVVVVDWSAGGNTWNYYKAAVNTKIVGYQISKFLQQVMNTTITERGSVEGNWGPVHLVGHSLGAHICGVAAKDFMKRQNTWIVKRITGLDPAQPCFKNVDPSVQLDKTDAPFVDVIHTNGRLLSCIGLGLPQPIGRVDFYPNGGKRQPGCIKSDPSVFDYLPIPQASIRQAICSHGRSYIYLTESLIAATMSNCSFWAHHWDLTYRNVVQLIAEPCDKTVCTEMGIKAEDYPHRGTFFAATASDPPFCINSTDVIQEVRNNLMTDNMGELED